MSPLLEAFTRQFLLYLYISVIEAALAPAHIHVGPAPVADAGVALYTALTRGDGYSAIKDYYELEYRKV